MWFSYHLPIEVKVIHNIRLIGNVFLENLDSVRSALLKRSVLSPSADICLSRISELIEIKKEDNNSVNIYEKIKVGFFLIKSLKFQRSFLSFIV